MGPGEGEALSRVESALEPLMPQHNDLSRSLLTLDQASTLIAVIEMSQSSWLVAGIVPGIARHPLKKINAEETMLLGLLRRWQDEAAQAGRTITRIAVAYEAGRDGFWLARWLRARGIEAYVIHPTSIPVSREPRRAKTDRLDTALLKRAFLGWLRGEPKHCSMVANPTLAAEEGGRPHPEHRGPPRAPPARARGPGGGAHASCEPHQERLGPPGHSNLQADAAPGARTSGCLAYAGRGTTAGEHAGRAAPRSGAPPSDQGADQGHRGRASGAASAGARTGTARDGSPAGAGDWHRR